VQAWLLSGVLRRTSLEQKVLVGSRVYRSDVPHSWHVEAELMAALAPGSTRRVEGAETVLRRWGCVIEVAQWEAAAALAANERELARMQKRHQAAHELTRRIAHCEQEAAHSRTEMEQLTQTDSYMDGMAALTDRLRRRRVL
jgi:hypothetical protein